MKYLIDGELLAKVRAFIANNEAPAPFPCSFRDGENALLTELDAATRIPFRADGQTSTALIKAIRAITVDFDEGRKPNGDAERALADVAEIMLVRQWPVDASALWSALCSALGRLTQANAEQCCELKTAAEEHFGSDFSTPTEAELAAGKAGV